MNFGETFLRFHFRGKGPHLKASSTFHILFYMIVFLYELDERFTLKTSILVWIKLVTEFWDRSDTRNEDLSFKKWRIKNTKNLNHKLTNILAIKNIFHRFLFSKNLRDRLKDRKSRKQYWYFHVKRWNRKYFSFNTSTKRPWEKTIYEI